MEPILLGTTDRTILVFIPDSASTDGSGKTALVAANLTVSYTRVETDNDVVVTDVTSSLTNLAALTDAHSDWGLLEVSSTLAPGLYRLDVADAVFAAGAWYGIVYVMVTTSAAAATPKAFQLVAYNGLDGVRLGLTGLANAVPGAAGGLFIAGTNAATTVTTALTTTFTGNLTGSVASVTGAVGSLTANNDKTGYALSATGSAALTEGYAADGATATLPQLLYMIWSALAQFAITSTTISSKKLDGTTEAMTFTLDSATDPTLRDRAT